MNRNPLRCSPAVWTVMAFNAALGAAAFAQVGTPLSTAITYQGRLELDGVAVNSPGCDVAFSLWNHPTDAFEFFNKIGPTLVFDGQGSNPPPVSVNDGMFTVELDFGSDAFFDNMFDGNGRWLEIAVACPSGGELTTLTPRQPLTAAPFALQTRGLSVDDNRRLGVGTFAAPDEQFRVHAREERAGHLMREDDNASGLREVLDLTALVTGFTAPAPGMGSRLTWRLEAPNGGLAQAGTIDVVWDDPDLSRAHMRFGTTNEGGTFERMRLTADGYLGIGTTAPQQLLHVRDGVSGVAPNSNARLVLERNNSTFLNILTPAGNQSGVLFGNPTGGSAAGGVLYNSADSPNGLQFRTNGNVARMTVTADGSVGIGTTAPQADLHVRGAGTLGELIVTPGTSDSHAQIRLTENTSASLGAIMKYDGTANQWQVLGRNTTVGETEPHLVVHRDNGRVGLGTTSPNEKLHVVGNIRASGSVFASCGTLVCSDARYKTNVRPVERALAVVEKLRPVRFDWKRDKYPDRHFNEDHQVGLIAQEVRQVAPEVVQKGSDGYLAVDYARLTPLLIEAVKEVRAEVRDREAEISALKTRNADLTARLEQLEKKLKTSLERSIESDTFE